MADRIKLLPEVVANQIAAGEVVNRPSSVVKEMMENAVDAKATHIKVNFRDGGKELIQIVDDGCGMSPIDARMAFDRHATSKIREVDDIYALQTFGFRGEALPSISAVAEVELRSRQAEDEVGTLTEIRGGEFVGQSPVACPVGSQFFVRNLFFNVPARRRFLEKSTTSATQIKNEFKRVALCYPEIAFELYANDAPIYSLPKASLANRIVDVIGRHIRQNLLDVAAETSIASVTGYIGRPAAAKRRNNEQYLFVNGRYFKSPYLVSAILKAYEKLVPANTQPSFFLFLGIDTSRIDVNVHPQKTEVKFSDEEAVWQIVNAAVRETLAKTGAVPMMDFDQMDAVDIPVLKQGVVYNEPKSTSGNAYNPFKEDYIDSSAENPSDDFTGFNLPRTSGLRRAEDAESWNGEDLSVRPNPKTNTHEDLLSEFSRMNREFSLDDDFEEFVSQEDGSSLEEEQKNPSQGQPHEEEFDEVESLASKIEVEDVSSEMNFGKESSLEEGFVEIPSVEGESTLEFVSQENEGVEQELQHLNVGKNPQFQHPMPLSGGLIAATLSGRLVVVDVKRARERILFENYLSLLGQGASVSQKLLFPERVILSNDEYALMEEQAVEFAALGFDLDFQGEGAVDRKSVV